MNYTTIFVNRQRGMTAIDVISWNLNSSAVGRYEYFNPRVAAPLKEKAQKKATRGMIKEDEVWTGSTLNVMRQRERKNVV